MIDIKMADALNWEKENCYCDWMDKSTNGYTRGNGYAYGMNCLPYPVLRRDSDGLIAFTPTTSDNPFSDHQWSARFFMIP